MILQIGMVTPASSARYFPILIATTKELKLHFCIDYRTLNQCVKPDRFPLPKIQEVLDELASGIYLMMLDNFSRY